MKKVDIRVICDTDDAQKVVADVVNGLGKQNWLLLEQSPVRPSRKSKSKALVYLQFIQK